MTKSRPHRRRAASLRLFRRRYSYAAASRCAASLAKAFARCTWLRGISVRRLPRMRGMPPFVAWAVFVTVASGRMDAASRFMRRRRPRTGPARLSISEEVVALGAAPPTRRRDLPPWCGVTTQFLVVMTKREKSLMLGVTGGGDQWGLVALEVPTPKGPEESARVYVERMFASHAHQMVGEYRTLEAACAAGDTYARRWMRVRRLKPCDCKPIAMGRAA